MILGVFMGSGLEALRKVRMGFWPSFGTSGAMWGHPTPSRLTLVVFMGSGLGLGTSGSSQALWGDPSGVYGVILGVFMGSGLGLGIPGVIPCPMGWSWGCLWGQGWVCGLLGSMEGSEPLGGLYGILAILWDT